MPLFRSLKQGYVMPLALLAFLIPLYWFEARILNDTKGIFMYPLDDVFIHMAIAKNLALHHVWGTSGYEFVSASSSILYPLILAAMYLPFGPFTLAPFLINLVAAILLLCAIHQWLEKQNLSPLQQLVILLSVIFFIPLPILVAIGMEHTLHILFCFLFIYHGAAWMEQQVNTNIKHWKPSWKVFLLGFLIAATRYESMFLITIVCCILLYYRQLELSFELFVVSMLPIIGFGLISLYHHNYFFPNSVLIKSVGVPADAHGIVKFLSQDIFEHLFYYSYTRSNVALQRLLIILPLTLLYCSTQKKNQLSYQFILITVLAGVVLHLLLAKTAWLYRYEAYLIACATVIISVIIVQDGRKVLYTKPAIAKLAMIFVCLILFFPFLLRTTTAYKEVEMASNNCFEHNYHVGRFFEKYYDTTRIALNDLGCISYYTKGKNLDLWGLGNIEVARSFFNHYNYTPFLDSLVKSEKIKVAALFDRFNDGPMLQSWKKVAIWHIDNVVIAADPDLSFYAVDTSMAVELKRHLIEYQPLLPPGVRVVYP